ncbi:MAG: hypothetical protein KDA68_16575 [Planctomycetaceae bacterium]|nr:hypothetical protein [Planctomycetaceae bacterium]MCA9097795.1 hypothetical protein [Planctomycetaceae bacterium]
MTGTMLNAGAKCHIGSATEKQANSASPVPAPHFRCKPKLTLEVLQADGSSRSLPVDSRQFFIGSDEDCELRLVHPDMPPVAAVIRVLDDGVWIEACRKSPDLRINREMLHQSWIKDGDEIEIAPFILKAHLGLKGTPSVKDAEAKHDNKSKSDPIVWEETELEKLSASEILDRIESDLDLIERDDLCRRTGEDTLLRAIRARQAAMSLDCETQQNIEEEPFVPRISIRLRSEEDSQPEAEEPRDLIQNLGRLIGELNSALQKLNDVATLTDSGVDIESLLSKLQSLEKPTPTDPPRAIA